MRYGLAFAVAGLAIFVAACDGSAAGGSCSTAADVGAKITALTDDLKKAQSVGKIDAMRAGEIGGRIMDAGATFGTGNHRTYCEALDRIRKDTGL